jgi:hypothetical protein
MSRINDALNQLLRQSWNEYDRLAECAQTVRPSLPILFFGDSDRYFSSPLKVITVGLNPSDAEFPEPDRFRRFAGTNDAATEADFLDCDRHLAVLNSYFKSCPYKKWFGSFEPILAGMQCSFYEGAQSIALHTDICTPIATSPTWSRLSRQDRLQCETHGVSLWHSLVQLLKPDAILISVARRHLDKVRFREVGSRQLIIRIERDNPYEAYATVIEIEPKKRTLLIFGSAAQTPFGKISNARKIELGGIIRGKVSVQAN